MSALPHIKIPYDSLTLRAVTAELAARLVGGQVQEIRQPDGDEVRLHIRNHGRNWILLLSCDARFARVHLTERKAPNAPVPPSFCMALRKHCEGAMIRGIEQRGFDRILEIEIGARDIEAAGVTLIAELMGKHGNLVLVSDGGAILDSAKRVSSRVNRFRETLPGLPYNPPPAQEARLDPFADSTPATVAAACRELTGESAMVASQAAIDLLSERVGGLSPFLAREIALRCERIGAPIAEAVTSVWQAIFSHAARGRFQPTLVALGERAIAAYPFPTVQAHETAQRSAESLNGALDSVYTRMVERAAITALITGLRGQIDRDRKRLERQRESAERAIREAGRADQYREAGELILANLWQIETGMKSITVQNYFDSELNDRTLALDPTLSPQENAEACFKRFRKGRDGAELAARRADEATALLERVAAAVALLALWEREESGTPGEIRQLGDELRALGLLQSHAVGDETDAKAPDFQGHKIRRMSTPEGYEIYVGETATANDFLTTRLAASNDLWLHVRSSTSAHVVIRTHGQPAAVPRSVLEYAALVCARHSSQKHSGLVPVDYTLRKYVRKPRGAAPGSADYHHETTLHVTP